MISAPLSAIDTFHPAFERMKRLLFSPFRFGIWWRVAFLAFFTGEMSNSGGFNFSFPGNFGKSSQPPIHMPSFPHMIAWIAAATIVFLVLMFVLIYVSSILRFVFFDAVLSGNVRIRDGWRRWKQRGLQLFPWLIGYFLVMLVIYAVVFGIPILMAWRAGVFRNAGQHLALLILGGLALLIFGGIISLAGLVVYVLMKDFVVPIMAFEGIGPIDGWRRLMSMMRDNKGSYAGYLGFKAVLAIAAGMILGILFLVMFVVFVMPLILVAVFLGILSAPGGTGISALAITLIVVGGLIVGSLMLCIAALFSVPFAVFFQSYALHFFGTRYEPLRAVMYPEPPQAPPIPPIAPMPQPAM